MCKFYGIGENEDIYIQEVAELRIACPLMPGWEVYQEPRSGDERWR